MFCCLFAALVLGPFGLWAMPRAGTQGGADCCAGSRRKIAAFGLIVAAVASLCLAAILMIGSGPIYFRNICSVWARP